jgi:DUF1016 N-terminal domain
LLSGLNWRNRNQPKWDTEYSMKPVKRAQAVTYDGLLTDVAHVIEAARRAAARSVNAVMTITYWLIGRRIVEQEQQGAARAGYGEELLKRLARDLSKRFGRGFSERNLSKCGPSISAGQFRRQCLRN